MAQHTAARGNREVSFPGAWCKVFAAGACRSLSRPAWLWGGLRSTHALALHWLAQGGVCIHQLLCSMPCVKQIVSDSLVLASLTTQPTSQHAVHDHWGR
jgi:hypothetical protein